MTRHEIARAVKPVLLFFAVLITFTFTPLAGQAASLKEIKSRGHMNIATEDN